MVRGERTAGRAVRRVTPSARASHRATENIMPPDSGSRATDDDTLLRRALGGMSVFTLAMTLPQVWTIWAQRQAAGVSVLSWGAYLLSALLWLAFGLRKRHRNIWLPCVAWIVLDVGVVAGALRYG